MGDLDEAIREHLELKRRRGADPAEVAREEQEALSPVTRGHRVVVPADLEHEPEHERENERSQNADAAPHQNSTKTPPDEDQGDATQEFRVEFGGSSDERLDEREA
jgi:hypothetical protein